MVRGLMIAIAVILMLPALSPMTKAADPAVEEALAKVRQHLDAGQNRQALQALFPAVYEIWEQTPMFLKRAVLVDGEPRGYGVFNPRPKAVYAAGEPIVVYLEPAAYSFKREKDGSYYFGFGADFAVATPEGRILGGQNDVGKFDFKSWLPNLETFIRLTIHLKGLPPGKYVLQTNLRDLVKGSNSTASLNFTLGK